MRSSIHPLRRSLLLATILALAATFTVTSAPAEAAALTTFETGKVVNIIDGDTIDVDVVGDGTVRVRLAGINTMEKGECNAQLATDRTTQLLDGKTVELRAEHRDSRSGDRRLRHVYVGTTDVSERLLRDGMGLWFPLLPETNNMWAYHRAAEEARVAGRGIWKDDRCGSGPSAGADLGLWVRSDADGKDSDNVNGEYAVIVNRGSKDVSLAGWDVRLSGLKTYRLPSGTSVKAGGRLTIRVGKGTSSASVHYLGRSSPWFRNSDLSNGLGNGFYLLDDDGDVRASYTWPYPNSDSDPLVGVVRISKVMYDPPGADTAAGEYISLKNVSSSRVRLDGYQVRVRHRAYEFRHNTYLNAGETLRLSLGKGTSSRLKQYWGRTNATLINSGDVVELLTYNERPVDCRAWGSKSCPARAIPDGPYTSCSGKVSAFSGDWDGSGKDGIGWWCDGKVKVRTSSGRVTSFNYGRKGDVPVVADWNGNGKDTVSVIRDGTWHVNNSLSGGASDRTFYYGRVTRGDVPLSGDWTAGSRDLPGIVRDTEWHLRFKQSGGTADRQFVYGRLTRGDLPLVGDWNGDRRDTVGIVRDGTWHLRNVHKGGTSDIEYVYGRVTRGDVPVVGDWNGDGKDTPAIVRDSRWHLKMRHGGGPADMTITFAAP